MGLTMKKILEKYSNCDVFSLTGRAFGYNVSEEEFLKALNKMESSSKEEKRKQYEDNKGKLVNYPDFDELYEEIKKECYKFDNEENKARYLRKHFDKKIIADFKKMGMSSDKIEEIKDEFFRCSFIADEVGVTTKYGSVCREFFWRVYHDIASIIDCSKKQNKYCINNGKDLLEIIPKELKEHFLYYEVSFFNPVTISDSLMVNYYFKLNDEAKKYLLQFRNDFCLNELEDLVFYKAGEVKFYSCTHEGFNSLEFDYKNMSYEAVNDFINDEFFKEDNDEIIKIVDFLIDMEVGTIFSFKELNIDGKFLMEKICSVCDKLNLKLILSNTNDSNEWSIVNEDGQFEKPQDLPAVLCQVEDLIEKIR